MDAKLNEIKDTVLELIVNLSTRIDDINDGYKLNGEIENDRIVNLLDDLQALAEGINLIQEYYGNIDLYELQEKLGIMTSALKDQDFSLFADITEYELKSLLEYWKKCLSN